MEGDKNDRPKWINSILRHTIYDIVSSINPVVSLKKAVSDLESGRVDSELLKRSNRLSKNPEDYENESKKTGLAIGARKGDVIEYYESDDKEGYSLNPQEISIRKYNDMLWKAVKDIFEIAGYEVESIGHELFQPSISHMVMPSRGVAGNCSCFRFAGVNKVAKDK